MIAFSLLHCRDVMCGMLHCTHLNEKLEFGIQSASKIAQSYIKIGQDKMLICHAALVDLGVGVVDPGLTPDGAICGKDKVDFCMSIYLSAMFKVIRKKLVLRPFHYMYRYKNKQ